MAKKETNEDKEVQLKLLKHIKKQTRKWDDKEFTKTESKLSDKAQEVTKLFETSFTGLNKDDKKSLAKAFGYILGEPISIQTDDKVELPRMVALVLTGAFDDHNYKLNEVIVHAADGVAIKADGSEGNWIEPPRKWVRPATDEEIDSLPKKQIEGLFEACEIVA